MRIERVAPPRILKRSYKPVLAALLSADGDWVRVPLVDLAGPNKASKAAKVLALARRHGIRVETTVQDSFVYVRLHKPDGILPEGQK